MKKIKKKEKKNLLSKAPVAILGIGLLAIGFAPFKAIKRKLNKKHGKKRAMA